MPDNDEAAISKALQETDVAILSRDSGPQIEQKKHNKKACLE